VINVCGLGPGGRLAVGLRVGVKVKGFETDDITNLRNWHRYLNPSTKIYFVLGRESGDEI
jgi:hypothetical protein